MAAGIKICYRLLSQLNASRQEREVLLTQLSEHGFTPAVRGLFLQHIDRDLDVKHNRLMELKHITI